MSSYIAKDTLYPRLFILACNVDALVVQSTLPETKLVLLNNLAASNDSIYPQVAIAASNEYLKFYKNSNVLAYYEERYNRASHVVDRSIANEYLFQSGLTETNYAGIGYCNETINFYVPATTAPAVSILYNSGPRLGIGTYIPTEALHVQGNILTSGTLTASNLVILGDSVILDTITCNTEQLYITNLGSGPALKVTQEGPQPVAEFYDDQTLTLVVADGGTVGIRTDYPRQTLDVNGTATFSSNVGIGTTNPREILDVIGQSIFSSNVGIGTTIPRDALDVFGNFRVSGAFYQNNTEVVFTNLIDGWQFNPSNSNVYYLNGNVGVGTSSALEKLHVIGNTYLEGNLTLSSSNIITASYLKGTASNVGYKIQPVDYLLGNSYDGSASETWTINASTTSTYNNLVARDAQSNIYLGGIGIGTTAVRQATTLDIIGSTILSGNLGIGTTNPNGHTFSIYASNGASHFSIDQQGNLGIGTTFSETSLSIRPTMYEPKITLWNLNAPTNSHYGFGVSSNQLNYHSIANHVFYKDGRNGDGIEYFRIQSDGNLGIGTSIARQKVDIIGSLILTCNLGIGTALPKEALDVYGNITTNNCNIYLGSGTIYASNFAGTVTQVVSSLTTNGYLVGESFNGSSPQIWSINATSNSSYNNLVARDSLSNIYIGGVGIGTTVARAKIDVIGNIVAIGNIGIGTTIPTQSLHIKHTDPIGIYLDNATTGIDFTTTQLKVQQGEYIFYSKPASVLTEYMRLDAAGNLGIGTTAPREKLDIIGNAKLSGQFQSTVQLPLPPFVITSTSLVSNLNIELFNDQPSAFYRNISNVNAGILMPLYGGTGCNLLPASKILVGSSTSPVTTPWELHWDSTNQRLGIATDQPQQRLDVRGSIVSSGNVGIGTVVPLYSLDIIGNMRATQPIISTLATGAAPFTISSTTLVTNLNVELLGGYNSDFYRNMDNAISGTLIVPRGGTGCNLLPSYKLLVGNGGDPITTPWELHWQNGNLGIGTNQPQSSLHVQQKIQSDTYESTASLTPPFKIQSSQFVSNLNVHYLNGRDGNYYTNVSNIETGILNTVYGGTGSNLLTTNKLLVGQGANGVISPTELHWGGNYLDITGKLTISSNVGINTVHPKSELEVTGNILTTTLGVGNTTLFSTFDAYGNLGIGTVLTPYPFQVYSTDTILAVQQGKLGIFKGASAAPAADIEIRNSSATDYTGILVHNNGNVNPGASIRIIGTRYDQACNVAYTANLGLQRYNNNGYLQANIPLGLVHFGGNHTSSATANRAYSAYIGAISEQPFLTSSNVATALIFKTGSNAYQYEDTSVLPDETMRLDSHGNLGIGTSQPAYKLDVQGSFQAGQGITSSLPTTYSGGPYHRQRNWNTSNSTHTISFPEYCMTTNSCGTLHIQVKSISAPYKLGNISASFLVSQTDPIDLFNVFYHQNNNLVNLNVTASNQDIVVTTDGECAIAWTTIGAC